jgi:membrane-bound ClpP family serine protease
MTPAAASIAAGAAGAPTSAEQRVVEVAVQRIAGIARTRGRDLLAVEEPLEIRLDYGAGPARTRRSITVTMAHARQ